MTTVQGVGTAGAHFLADSGHALMAALSRDPPPQPWSGTAQLPVDSLAQAGRTDPAARVRLGGVHGGQGNDAVSGDFPVVDGVPTLPAAWGEWSWARIAATRMSAMTDQELLDTFGREYGLASHYNPVTATQVERFTSGLGGTVVSVPGSEMSTLIAESGEGQALATTLTARLQGSAETLLAQWRTVDVKKLSVELDSSDRLSWGMNPTNPMFGLVGSTDGIKAKLVNGNYDSTSRRLTGTLRITVTDRFGLSNQDTDSPGQIAMWLLQHQRGYRSFENMIVYDVPVDVTLRAPAVRGGTRGQDRPIP